MTRATKFRDVAHARIYSAWINLPAWLECSIAARMLLVEMLARFRPGENGKLEWSVRRAAGVLRVSKSTAATALIELETTGWVEVMRAGRFSKKSAASHYALTMFVNDVTDAPAAKAFEYWRPDGPRPLAARCRVSRQERSVRPEVQHSPSADQKQSAAEDTEAH